MKYLVDILLTCNVYLNMYKVCIATVSSSLLIFNKLTLIESSRFYQKTLDKIQTTGCIVLITTSAREGTLN